jgi:flavin reductase
LHSSRADGLARDVESHYIVDMSWSDQHPDMAGAFAAIAETKIVEQKAFREAMSRLGAAVHVITTDGSSGKTGFTATAVCSVSDSPPTLLVCLNRAATSMPILRSNGVFCVNTLRAGDELIADTFAGRTKVARESRFDTGEWSTLSTGAPALMSAGVAFDCRVIEIKAVASHDIYFGMVEAIHEGAPGAALVYHDRAYKQV